MAHIRTAITVACLACLGTATARGEELAAASSDAALALGPGGPIAPIPSAPPSVSMGRRRHLLGLQLDAGVPDGASATLLYRPLKFLRLGGGLLYNYAGYGVRGGVTILPYFPIAPSLSLEVGHYFNANAASRVSQYTTVSDGMRMLLNDVGYTFAQASVGLEIGHPDWFVFFVRGGLSRVWLSVKNVNATAQQLSSNVYYADDPAVGLNTPTVKVGCIFFIY
jgi:hypothetical protein